jgi:apolipoprotein N-acyltransferase
LKQVTTRKQRVIAGLLSGVLFGLSQPLVLGFLGPDPIDPTGLSGLLVFVCFVPVLLVTRDDGPKATYWTAFLALIVAFTIHLYWIVLAMVVYGSVPILVSILTLLLLTAALGFWCATAFGVTRLVARRFAFPPWLVFAACLCAADYLRNFGPVGGFSWATSGNSLATVPLLLQGGSLFGVYGLVFVIALVNGVIAELLYARARGDALPRQAALAGAGAMALLLAWGGFRLATEPELPTVKIGLLQGNIDQKKKNESLNYRREIERNFHRLQKQAIAEGAEIVVWPEAALPGTVRAEWKTLKRSGVVPRRAPPEERPKAAIVGAVAYERRTDVPKGEKDPRRLYRSYNTAIVTKGEDLEVVGRFDKARLVPFGEYVPWPIDVAIRQIVPGGMSAPGGDYRPISMPGGGRDVPVGTTICYEGIFPEITREFANDGAQLMFNVTNDAWYGVSSAAKQHLLMYAVRAAETGRAVARAANTGISAWVDTRGRLHDETAMYEEAFVVADVPINDETTPYMLLGDWLAIPATTFALLAWFYALLGTGFWRRERHAIERAIGVIALTLAFGGVGYYFVFGPEVRDEAFANRAAFGVIGALLAGIGALSGRPWGRKAQLWVGWITFVLCGLGALFGAWLALPFAIFGGVTAGLAKRRKDAYVRDADPLRAPGRAPVDVEEAEEEEEERHG